MSNSPKVVPRLFADSCFIFLGSMPGVIQVCQAVVICHIFLPLFIHSPFSVAVLQKVPVPCHPYFRIMCCASFQWLRLVSSGTSVPKFGSTSSILNKFISSWRRSFLCYCWGGDPRPRNHLHPLNRDQSGSCTPVTSSPLHDGVVARALGHVIASLWVWCGNDTSRPATTLGFPCCCTYFKTG